MGITLLPQFAKEYLEYLEVEKGMSPRTVDNYGRYLRRFFDWSEITKPEDITEDVILRYRIWIGRKSKNKVRAGKRQWQINNDRISGEIGSGSFQILPDTSRSFPVPSGSFRFASGYDLKTRNYHLIVLRQLLRFLIRRNVAPGVTPEKIDLAKVPPREITPLIGKELPHLLDAPDGMGMRAVRDRAILNVLFSTGLRVSELCSLAVGMVNIAAGEFGIRGKGGKIRPVYLSERAKESLFRWLEARKNVIDPALFVSLPRGKSRQYRRLTPRSVQRIVRYYAIKAGIVSKKVTPHTLRHQFATDLLRSGADLRSVQALLGHANIATTQIYTHVTDPQLHEVHKKFHGKSLEG